MKKRYLSQFASEMFDIWFEFDSFVTMVTYLAPDLPILKAFQATFGVAFSMICKWCLIYMIQQAYEYVSLSLLPCLTFFEVKITYMLKSRSGWGLEKSELPWEQNVL